MALPGVRTIIRDKFYLVSRTNIPVGPRVAIIGKRDTASGTNTSGEVGDGGVQDLDPWNATNGEAVANAFGEDSQLNRGYIEAVSGGAQSVVLVPLPSDTVFDHTTATITSASYVGDDLFDDAFAAAGAARPDVIVPWGRGIHPDEYESPAASPAVSGAELEIGFHADNSTTPSNSWAYKVAKKCYEITEETHPCFGVLGIAPYGANPEVGATPSSGDLTFESMTPGQIATHLSLSNLVDKALLDMGSYGPWLSVIATELKPLGYDTGWGYANGAATYAGAVCQLDSWSSPTNKVVFNIEKLRYNPVPTTQLSMIDDGVVPVTLDFNRTPIWRDAQTFGKDASDYRRLTTLRIIFDAVLMVRQISQQYIGEAATLSNQNAFETSISSGLKSMQEQGALYSSNFAVEYIREENKANVDLVLNPAFELRNIDVRVSIQF